MRTAAKTKARLIFVQGLCLVLLAVLSLSVRVDPTAPAFSGEGQAPGEDAAITVSIQGVILSKAGMAKDLLRVAFPVVGYSETIRSDDEAPGILAEALGLMLGFVPRYPRDLVFGEVSGFLADSESLDIVMQAVDLEDDWGLMPVLYSLPPGEEAIAATIATGTDPLVAVYHTHATESFLPELGKKDALQAFSSNMSETVVKVGEMLATALQSVYRIPSLHSATVHDKDTRLGAYYRSEATVKAILQKYPSCKVLVDVHRDSQPRNITAVTVRGKSYARLLIVIGTDNPNWVSNNEFARQILAKLDEAYPGLSRGIMFESAVYNQKHSPKAILVEFGGVDNTMEECRNSAEALAWAMASVMLPTAPARP